MDVQQRKLSGRTTRRMRPSIVARIGVLSLAGVLGLTSTVVCLAQSGPKSIFDDDWKAPNEPEPVRPKPAQPTAPPPVEFKPEPRRLKPKVTPNEPPQPPPRVVTATRVRPKQAIPTGAALATAEKLVKDTFDVGAKRTAAEQLSVARQMLSEAQSPQEDARNVYVLLREARDLATSAGGVETALEAARGLRAQYVMDLREAQEMLRATLSNSVKALTAQPATVIGSIDARRATELALAIADDLLAAGDYPAASQAANEAVVAAARAGSNDILFGARQRATELQSVAAEFEQVRPYLARLHAIVPDGNANLIAGRFYAFTVARPDVGMPMLARSSDAAVKAAAMTELSTPAVPVEEAALAEQWATASKSLGPTLPVPLSAAAKDGMVRRALYWYGKAADQSQGAARVAMMKRSLELRTPRLQKGLAVDYFHGCAFQQLVYSASETTLYHDFRGRAPDDALPGEFFSARWTGFLRAAPGHFRIIAVHDDGIRVWLDGQLIIDAWRNGMKRSEAEVEITGALQELKVEYYQGKGSSAVALGWLPPGAKRVKVISGEMLFHDAPPLLSPPTPQRPPVDRDGAIQLTAAFADLHGATISYVGDSDPDHIGNWENVNDWISWDFSAAESDYRVDLVSTGGNGADYALTVGGNRLAATAPANGSWSDYRTETLGTIHLSAGEQTLRIKPTGELKGKLMGLSKIVLTPVKGQ